MKIFAILISLFFSYTASAVVLEGNLQVVDSLRVKRQDGFKSYIYQGSYPSQLWNVGRADMLLRVERKGVFIDIPIRVPADHPLPGNGEFSLPGGMTGQTFDTAGNASTTQTRSEPVRGYESCVYYREVWVCRGYGRHRYCRWETMPVDGAQDVEYYFLTTDYRLNINFTSAGNQPASFAGRSSERQKIYTYRSECY